MASILEVDMAAHEPVKTPQRFSTGSVPDPDFAPTQGCEKPSIAAESDVAYGF